MLPIPFFHRRTVAAAICAVAGLVGVFGAATPAHAQIESRTIKFPSASNKGHPQVWGVEKFVEIVKAKSGGKLKVQEFPASQLGNELQQQSALQGGVQEMLVASTTSLPLPHSWLTADSSMPSRLKV